MTGDWPVGKAPIPVEKRTVIYQEEEMSLDEYIERKLKEMDR